MSYALIRKISPAVFVIFTLLANNVFANGLTNNSLFDQEQTRIKYGTVNYSNGSDFLASQDQQDFPAEDMKDNQPGYKSPGKAFVLSLILPGMGQFYNGHKLKSAAFLGIEATAWIFNVKLNNEGDDINDEFEAYNREHWSRDSYEQKFLLWTYGVTDDDSVAAGIMEISHHLPDELIQQYYEMTGKYDQFAWGWDDANIDGNYIDDYDVNNAPPRMTSDATTPNSANRLWYEQRRNDSNNKYDQAKRMVYVALVNRVVSAFEALISARKINSEIEKQDNEFTSLKFNAKLKSVYTKRDTPYFSVTYKF